MGSKALRCASTLCLLFIFNCSLISAQHVDKSGLTGELTISTFVDSFYVVLNEDFEDYHKMENHGTLTLEKGEYRVRLIQKYHRDALQTVNIEPGKDVQIRLSLVPFSKPEKDKKFSSYPRIKWESPVIVLSDYNATLLLDEQYAGIHAVKTDRNGIINVRSILPGGEFRTKAFEVNTDENPFTVLEVYNRPDKNRSHKLSFIPGATRLHQNSNFRGALLMGSFITGTGLATRFHFKYRDNYSEFENAHLKYLTSQPPVEPPEVSARYKKMAENHLDSANRFEKLRNATLFSLTGIYIINIIDAYIEPKRGYRERFAFDPYIDFDSPFGEAAGINVNMKFN